MERSGKQGLGAAYRAGFAWGLERGYDALVEMDADLSHPLERLPALLDGLATADLVIGSRYVPGGRTVNWSRLREAISRGGNAYVRLALGMPVHDCTAGYCAYRRGAEAAGGVGAVQRLPLPDRDGPQDLAGGVPGGGGADHLHRAGLGVSKMSKQIVAEALLRVTQWALTGGRAGPSGPIPAAWPRRPAGGRAGDHRRGRRGGRDHRRPAGPGSQPHLGAGHQDQPATSSTGPARPRVASPASCAPPRRHRGPGGRAGRPALADRDPRGAAGRLPPAGDRAALAATDPARVGWTWTALLDNWETTDQLGT